MSFIAKVDPLIYGFIKGFLEGRRNRQFFAPCDVSISAMPSYLIHLVFSSLNLTGAILCVYCCINPTKVGKVSFGDVAVAKTDRSRKGESDAH